MSLAPGPRDLLVQVDQIDKCLQAPLALTHVGGILPGGAPTSGDTGGAFPRAPGLRGSRVEGFPARDRIDPRKKTLIQQISD